MQTSAQGSGMKRAVGHVTKALPELPESCCCLRAKYSESAQVLCRPLSCFARATGLQEAGSSSAALCLDLDSL